MPAPASMSRGRTRRRCCSSSATCRGPTGAARPSRRSTSRPCSARSRRRSSASTMPGACPNCWPEPGSVPAADDPDRWSSHCRRTCFASVARHCRSRRRRSRHWHPMRPRWRHFGSCWPTRNDPSCWSGVPAGRSPQARRCSASPNAGRCRSGSRSGGRTCSTITTAATRVTSASASTRPWQAAFGAPTCCSCWAAASARSRPAAIA